MSGFDKEAERERLREKYEKDQEKREATQRMSELLLQGATMTNRHCEECGDPIFRYEGQEFCPTCQTTKGGADEQAAAEQAAAADAPETQANGQAAGQQAPTEAERPPEQSRDDEPAGTETGARGQTERLRAGGDQPRTASTPATDDSAADADPERARAAGSAPEPARPPTPETSREGEASLERARASLVRTLTRFAEAAERADDPRRATELLGAAREAAETLDALER